jgi:hypothetical protein
LPRLLRRADGYPKNRRWFIVGMMRKFELCFEFPDGSGRLLIPGLLSANEIDLDWEELEPLRFEFHYEVLPEGVIPRFIVRTHEHLTDPPTYWRTGVLLRIDGNKALVRGEVEAGRIEVAVFGPKGGRRSALAVVRSELAAIHGSLKRLEVQQMLPLPDQPEILVDYLHLLELERLGEQNFVPPGAGKRYSVRELLDGIEEPKVRQARERDRHRGDIYQAERMTVVSSRYENRGQVGAMGTGAHAEGNTFQQVYLEAAQNLDLPVLAEALGELRQKLPAEAEEPAHYEALAEVSKAEKAAKEGKGETVLRHLKAAGQWTFDTATKVGIRVAAEAIKGAMGMP